MGAQRVTLFLGGVTVSGWMTRLSPLARMGVVGCFGDNLLFSSFSSAEGWLCILPVTTDVGFRGELWGIRLVF